MVAIQRVGLPGLGHQEHACVGQVVAVEEFAARRARAPDREAPVPPHLGLMGLADQGGQDVAGLQIVVITRAVKVGGHDGKISGAVLAVVSPAHLDAGDLGHSVGAVRGFQGPGKEVFFLDRLRAQLRINAG